MLRISPSAILLLVCLTTTSQSSPILGFDTFDKDHDGKISRDEYDSAVSLLTNGLNTPSENAKLGNNLRSDSKSSATNDTHSTEGESNLKFLPAFLKSLMMILATEIGDKTFFIAAVLSMRNARLPVFSGAILALCIMTVLSSLMGVILPSLLPRQYMHIVSGLLFLYFGVRLLLDSTRMTGSKCSGELEEVEEELLHKKKNEETSVDDTMDSDDVPKKPKKEWESIFLQALTLTFIAEWGDRSQIATIALAAAKDPYGVNAGAMFGHSICTGMAVIGGRMLAANITEKSVTLFGGVIFLIFGVHSLLVEEA